MSHDSAPPKEQGFIEHLLELRDRLVRIVLSVGILFIVLVPFAKNIYNYFSEPLVSQLPDGGKLLAITVAGPFLVPYKLTLLVAFLIALPFIFHQLWGFIAPALYKHEKRLVLPLLGSSVILFYAGMAFAFYVVLPIMFDILPGFAPDNVEVAPDIAQYLDFVMMIFMAFGIGFEMPVATVLLITTGMVSRENLAKKRPYVIVVAFIVGMFLTPPDVVSQILLAIPMWFLFEIGLIASGLFKKQIQLSGKEKEDREQTESQTDDSRYAAVITATGTSATTAAEQTTENTQSTLWEDEKYLFEEYDASTEEESNDDDEYKDMTDEEMEAELDRLEAEEEEEEEEEEEANNNSSPDSSEQAKT
jgi:sec-independent protein translocase protein TatC